MYLTHALPTKFAIELARTVKLSGKDITKSSGQHTTFDENTYYKLQEFQQMIVGGATFEEALFAYHGMDLEEEQENVLKIIAKSTKPWLLGHIGGQLMDKLKSADGKNLTDAADIIINDIMQKGEGGKSMKKTRQLLVTMTGGK